MRCLLVFGYAFILTANIVSTYSTDLSGRLVKRRHYNNYGDSNFASFDRNRFTNHLPATAERRRRQTDYNNWKSPAQPASPTFVTKPKEAEPILQVYHLDDSRDGQSRTAPQHREPKRIIYYASLPDVPRYSQPPPPSAGGNGFPTAGALYGERNYDVGSDSGDEFVTRVHSQIINVGAKPLKPSPVPVENKPSSVGAAVSSFITPIADQPKRYIDTYGQPDQPDTYDFQFNGYSPSSDQYHQPALGVDYNNNNNNQYVVSSLPIHTVNNNNNPYISYPVDANRGPSPPSLTSFRSAYPTRHIRFPNSNNRNHLPVSAAAPLLSNRHTSSYYTQANFPSSGLKPVVNYNVHASGIAGSPGYDLPSSHGSPFKNKYVNSLSSPYHQNNNRYHQLDTPIRNSNNNKFFDDKLNGNFFNDKLTIGTFFDDKLSLDNNKFADDKYEPIRSSVSDWLSHRPFDLPPFDLDDISNHHHEYHVKKPLLMFNTDDSHEDKPPSYSTLPHNITNMSNGNNNNNNNNTITASFSAFNSTVSHSESRKKSD